MEATASTVSTYHWQLLKHMLTLQKKRSSILKAEYHIGKNFVLYREYMCTYNSGTSSCYWDLAHASIGPRWLVMFLTASIAPAELVHGVIPSTNLDAKMATEAISEHLINKLFLGEHAPDPPSLCVLTQPYLYTHCYAVITKPQKYFPKF